MRGLRFGFLLLCWLLPVIAWAESGVLTAPRDILHEPSYKTGKPVAKLKKGEAVDILDKKGPWWKVRSKKGEEGWMAKRLIRVTGEKAPGAEKSPPVFAEEEAEVPTFGADAPPSPAAASPSAPGKEAAPGFEEEAPQGAAAGPVTAAAAAVPAESKPPEAGKPASTPVKKGLAWIQPFVWANMNDARRKSFTDGLYGALTARGWTPVDPGNAAAHLKPRPAKKLAACGDKPDCIRKILVKRKVGLMIGGSVAGSAAVTVPSLRLQRLDNNGLVRFSSPSPANEAKGKEALLRQIGEALDALDQAPGGK
ncbi:MAG: hypothetical protein GMKNLPBB_02062 [Myxococcota bacterium]|nr:hypothetical protein [Myxococcota bacterium]